MFNKKILILILITALLFGLGILSIVTFIKKPEPLKPQYNFLYSDFGADEYYVENSKLVKAPCTELTSSSVMPPVIDPAGKFSKPYVRFCNTGIPVKLYIHDVRSNTSTKITFENTQSLKLNSNKKSLDGLVFEPNYGDLPGGNIASNPVIGGPQKNYPVLINPGTGSLLKLNIAPSGGKPGFKEMPNPNNYSSASFVGWIELYSLQRFYGFWCKANVCTI
jgi:hypothetical protein